MFTENRLHTRNQLIGFKKPEIEARLVFSAEAPEAAPEATKKTPNAEETIDFQKLRDFTNNTRSTEIKDLQSASPEQAIEQILSDAGINNSTEQEILINAIKLNLPPNTHIDFDQTYEKLSVRITKKSELIIKFPKNSIQIKNSTLTINLLNLVPNINAKEKEIQDQAKADLRTLRESIEKSVKTNAVSSAITELQKITTNKNLTPTKTEQHQLELISQIVKLIKTQTEGVNKSETDFDAETITTAISNNQDLKTLGIDTEKQKMQLNNIITNLQQNLIKPLAEERQQKVADLVKSKTTTYFSTYLNPKNSTTDEDEDEDDELPTVTAPKEFFDKIKSDEDKFINALNENRITSGHQLKSGLNRLQIKHEKFADYQIDGLDRNNLDSETLFDLAKPYKEKYKEQENLLERYQELQKKDTKTSNEQAEFALLEQYVLGVGETMEAWKNMQLVEAKNYGTHNPNRITEVEINTENKSLEVFDDDDLEILAALMIYYYGERNAVNNQYIQYSHEANKVDGKVTLKINKFANEEDANVLRKIYDDIRKNESWTDVFRCENLTEAFHDFFNHPDFKQFEQQLYALRVGYDDSTNTLKLNEQEIAKAHLRFIFNPSFRGAANEDYQTLNESQLSEAEKTGEVLKAVKYFENDRSGLAAYTNMLDRTCNRETGEFDLNLLAEELTRFAITGKDEFQKLVEAGLATEEEKKLANLEIPNPVSVNDNLKKYAIREDYVALIRQGYLVNKKLESATQDVLREKTKSELETIEKSWGRDYAEASDKLLFGLDLTDTQKEKLNAGAAIVCAYRFPDNNSETYKTQYFEVSGGAYVYQNVLDLLNTKGLADRMGVFIGGAYGNVETGTRVEAQVGLNLGLIPGARASFSQEIGNYYIRLGASITGSLLGTYEVGGGHTLDNKGYQNKVSMFNQYDTATEDINNLTNKQITGLFNSSALKNDPAINAMTPEEKQKIAETIFNLRKEALEMRAVKKLDEENEWGWEVGLMNIHVAGIPTPIVVPYLTIDWVDETFVKYDLKFSPEQIQSSQEAEIRRQLQAATSAKPSNILKVETGNIVINEQGQLQINEAHAIPDIANNFGYTAEAINENTARYGLKVEDIDLSKTSHLNSKNLSNYKEAGYDLYSFDVEMLEGTNINFVFDKGLKDQVTADVITKEVASDGRIYLAVNTQGADNLYIHTVKHISASGDIELSFYFTNNPYTPSEIELSGAEVINYNNGYAYGPQNGDIIRNSPQTLTAKFDNLLTDKEEQTKATTELMNALKANPADFNETLSYEETKELQNFVNILKKKQNPLYRKLNGFLTLSVKNNYQQTKVVKAVQELIAAYKKAKPGKELKGSSLAYLLDYFAISSFTKINQTPAKNRENKVSRINKDLSTRFVNQAIDKNPNLTNFKENKQNVIDDLNKQLATSLSNSKENLITDKVTTEAIPGDIFFASMTNNNINGTPGYRLIGLSEKDGDHQFAEMVKGSLNKIDANSLAGQFIFKLLDPIDYNEQNPAQVLKGRLATKILSAPLGNFAGQRVNIVTSMIGAENSKLLAELLQKNETEIQDLTSQNKYKDAIKAFQAKLDEIRNHQLNGTPFTIELANGYSATMEFNTEAYTMLRADCANGDLGIKQDITINYFNEGKILHTATLTENSWEQRAAWSQNGIGFAASIPLKGRANNPHKGPAPREDTPNDTPNKLAGAGDDRP